MSETPSERVIWVVELRMEKRTVEESSVPWGIKSDVYWSHYRPDFESEAAAEAAFKAADAALKAMPEKVAR